MARNPEQRILSLEDLGTLVSQLRADGKRVAHCHGVFDLLHPGHFKHFDAAKSFGDVLVVTITEDQHVNKGPDRPVFEEGLRAETVAAVESVDYVAINRDPTAIPAIETIQPDFYVKGQDYKMKETDLTGEILNEKNAVEKHGGQLVHTEEVQFSSSKLINRHLSTHHEEAEAYLGGLRERYGFDHFKEIFDRIGELNVLVIGDVILDEYQFVQALGKASKSATITAKMLDNELYAGGAVAVANHVADFVSSVTLISSYGLNRGKDYGDFIREHLHDNVTFEGVYDPDRPTTLKRRFVDQTFKHKLFEAIEIDDSPMEGEPRDKFHQLLQEAEDSYDMILVADFGHGMLDQESIDILTGKNIFLAGNTQTNSANQGFNLLTKYPRLDYFSIDKDEARLAMHDQYGRIEDLQRSLLERTRAKLGAVTLGVDGSCVMAEGKKPSYAPVLNTEVVDTIGAGDAFLSVTALLARIGRTPEEIGFVGNAVGSMAVKILGNKSYIERTALLKYLKTLLS